MSSLLGAAEHTTPMQKRGPRPATNNARLRTTAIRGTEQSAMPSRAVLQRVLTLQASSRSFCCCYGHRWCRRLDIVACRTLQQALHA